MVLGPSSPRSPRSRSPIVHRRPSIARRAAPPSSSASSSPSRVTAARRPRRPGPGLVRPRAARRRRDPQTGFITAPDRWSVVVAVLAGVAGVLSLTVGQERRAGRRLHLGHHRSRRGRHGARRWRWAAGRSSSSAATQLGINLAGILVAATATLAVQRAVWRRVPSDRPARRRRRRRAPAERRPYPAQDPDVRPPAGGGPCPGDPHRRPPPHRATAPQRGLLLVGVAIVLTGLNLRTAVGSVGPVLEEIEAALGSPAPLAGLLTTHAGALLRRASGSPARRCRPGSATRTCWPAALVAMAAGLVLRSPADSFWLFLVGTVLAMTGGALGNVLLPSLVKRYFPDRTGLMVGAYGVALGARARPSPSVRTAAHRRRVGTDDGWRWGLGLWAVLAVVAALAWLAVPARRGSSRASHAAVRCGRCCAAGWRGRWRCSSACRRCRPTSSSAGRRSTCATPGLSAAAAGWLLGFNTLLGHPDQRGRARARRPAAAAAAAAARLLCCYVIGWIGLWVAPAAAPWLWMVLLGRRPRQLPAGADPVRAARPHPGDDGGAVHLRPGRGLPHRRRRAPAGRPAARRHRRLHGMFVARPGRRRRAGGAGLAGHPPAVRRGRDGPVRPGRSTAGARGGRRAGGGGRRRAPVAAQVRPGDGSPRG